MRHAILKQIALYSSVLMLALSCVPLPAASADQTPAQQACSSLDFTTSSSEKACETGYGAYKPGVTKTQACTQSQYPNNDDLDGCYEGYDAAQGSDPAIDASCTNTNCDLLTKYVDPAINLLSVLFGLVIVISLILGGIQFASSEGDPQKASQAKNRISNTILALFVYALFYAFVQFLVPGGLFKG